MSYLQGLLIITLLFVGLVYLFGWVDRLSRRRAWGSKENRADSSNVEGRGRPPQSRSVRL